MARSIVHRITEMAALEADDGWSPLTYSLTLSGDSCGQSADELDIRHMHTQKQEPPSLAIRECFRP